jgi:hypothetical protein
MILDSMKTRGFYAFFNGMKFSGTLGLYLVALFMCLGFEVKAVDLPVHAVYEDQHNGKDVTSLQMVIYLFWIFPHGILIIHGV